MSFISLNCGFAGGAFDAVIGGFASNCFSQSSDVGAVAAVDADAISAMSALGVSMGGADGGVVSADGVLPRRRSRCELDCENAARVALDDDLGASSSASWVNSGGLNGAIFSGECARVVWSEALAPAADVLRRAPQLLHASASCGFIVPQMGQRMSVEGCSSAAQFLQNLLLGLLGVPHCGQ